MNRRAFVAGVFAAVFAPPPLALEEETIKVVRPPVDRRPPVVTPFRERMWSPTDAQRQVLKLLQEYPRRVMKHTLPPGYTWL